MAGALLGMALGGVVGYAGAKHRERMQDEEEARQWAQQAFSKAFEARPSSILTQSGQLNPAWVKQAKKHFGQEYPLLEGTFLSAATADRRDRITKLNQSVAFGQMVGGPLGQQMAKTSADTLKQDFGIDTPGFPSPTPRRLWKPR